MGIVQSNKCSALHSQEASILAREEAHHLSRRGMFFTAKDLNELTFDTGIIIRPLINDLKFIFLFIMFSDAIQFAIFGVCWRRSNSWRYELSCKYKGKILINPQTPFVSEGWLRIKAYVTPGKLTFNSFLSFRKFDPACFRVGNRANMFLKYQH